MNRRRKIIVVVSVVIVVIMILPLVLLTVNNDDTVNYAVEQRQQIDCPEMMERSRLIRDFREFIREDLRVFRWETPVLRKVEDGSVTSCIILMRRQSDERLSLFTICTKNHEDYRYSFGDSTQDCFDLLNETV